jgi:hypothetical protein
MKQLSLFGLALTLALPLLAAGRPAAAAQQVTAVAQAAGEKDPFTLSWLDDAQGKTTKTDQATSKKIHDVFAGAQYIITDQNQLIVGQGNGSNLQVVLAANAVDVSNGKGYYVVHQRGQGLFLDGTVYRFGDDPTSGIARLTLVLIDQQGNSASTYIEQLLTWASSNPGPGSNPGGSNPFGFGP